MQSDLPHTNLGYRVGEPGNQLCVCRGGIWQCETVLADGMPLGFP